MRIGVLAAAESWYFRDLARVASAACDLVRLDFELLASGVSSAGKPTVYAGEHDLGSFEAVIVRSMPPGTLEQIVFRMDLLGQLAQGGCVVLNPPRALEAAIDKYLTTAKLAAVGLPVPRTYVCQTAQAALAAFAELGQDIVLKPLFGSEGRGLTRITDEALAERAFRLLEQLGSVIYLQEFVPHFGYDVRVFTLGQRAFGMRRVNPNDWRTNVSRGATVEACELTPPMLHLAFTAAAAVGAPMAGVDLLPARDGSWYVIEVNAVPGWQALARATGEDIAAHVWAFTLAEIHARQKDHP
jgi:ribosomal protein S6--L-glutamate ligase